MRAYYSSPAQICVELLADETLGLRRGPVEFYIGMAPGNAEYDALMTLVAAEQITIEPYRSLDPGFDMGRTMAELLT
jgi:hypothetical protein